MRKIATILAAILLLKVAIQEYVWRAATEEVLVAAYAEQALEACRSQIRARIPTQPGATIAPSELRFGVGDQVSDVALWDVNNRDWTRRYRTPFLRLSFFHAQRQLKCNFDLMQRQAELIG